MNEPGTSSPHTRDERIGRILNELHDLRSRGELHAAQDLIEAHPDLADELKPYLEMLGELRSEGDRIRRLVDEGVLRESDDPAFQASLGSYKTIGFIGRGGMGIVLKAHEQSLNRTVALKILRPELADDKASLERFKREAKAAGMLRHPNIVTVHAVGEQHGVHYIAMEYIDGPTLADVIREQGLLPTETARRLFAEILQGLSAAHEAGLIHRDIKSANILLDGPQRQAKIADFGLARMMASQTRLTLPESTPGTPEYMSPEQSRGDENIDHRTDLYSAGVVLYEMLTGRTPFRSEAPAATLHRITHEDPIDPRRLNARTDALLSSISLRLLAKEPADRYSSAGTVLSALGSGKPVRRPEMLRHRIRLAVLGALLAGAVFLVAWLQPAATRPDLLISHMQIAPDDHGVIEVQYGQEATWRRFDPARVFDSDVRFSNAVKLNPGKPERSLFVVGASHPQTVDDLVLFAFEPNGKEAWTLPLCQDYEWPDDQHPTACWTAEYLKACNIDGVGDDELIVVANHPNDCPSRICVIETHPEPRIISSFWNFGHTNGLRIIPDYFGADHPALLIWGRNNKLDEAPVPGESGPSDRPVFRIVPIVALLDPQNLGGLIPPSIDGFTIAGTGPWAYAYLNLATDSDKYPEGNPTTLPTEIELGFVNIEDGALDISRTGDAEGLTIEVKVMMPKDPENARAILVVNGNLEFQLYSGTANETKTTEEFWRERWVPIVQRGEYVLR